MTHLKVRPRPRPKRGQPTGRLCDERRCRLPWSVECWLYDEKRATDVLDGRYCGPHAVSNGFCRGCGNFAAGSESFDFDPRGLCGNCRSDPLDEDEAADDYDLDVYPDGIPEREDEQDRMAELFMKR